MCSEAMNRMKQGKEREKKTYEPNHSDVICYSAVQVHTHTHTHTKPVHIMWRNSNTDKRRERERKTKTEFKRTKSNEC